MKAESWDVTWMQVACRLHLSHESSHSCGYELSCPSTSRHAGFTITPWKTDLLVIPVYETCSPSRKYSQRDIRPDCRLESRYGVSHSIDKFFYIDSALITFGNFLLTRSTFDFVIISWK